MQTALDIAQGIVDGKRLQPTDDLEFFLTTPLDELQAGARLIQRKFFGNHIDLCTIINGKSGRCGEDCKYCAQSARHHTGIDEYDFLPAEKILEVALANEQAGVNRFSIVTSGRALSGKNFERAIDTYKFLRGRLKIGLPNNFSGSRRRVSSVIITTWRLRGDISRTSVRRTLTTTELQRLNMRRRLDLKFAAAGLSAWAKRGKIVSTWRLNLPR